MIFPSDPGAEPHAYFVTFCCYRRRRLLDHPRMRDIVAFIFAEKLTTFRAVCVGYVIMPDHVHSIVWLPETDLLSHFMKSWKQTSSLKLKRVMRGLLPNYAARISSVDPFWQAKYFPFVLYSEQKAQDKLDYMHMNPVNAGLVTKAVDWKWSSARCYLLGEPVDVPVEWIFS